MPRTSKLIVDESPLTVIRSLATAIGLNEAIVLQQVHFLLESNGGKNGKVIDGERYVYNSYTGWQQKFFPFWSVDTVQRVFEKLEQLGILRQPADQNSRLWRKYHRIDRSKIPQFAESSTSGIPQDAESLPQNAESSARIPQNAVPTCREDYREVAERKPKAKKIRVVEPDESATATPKQEFQNRIQVPDEIRNQPKPSRSGNGKTPPRESPNVLRLRLLQPNAMYFQALRCWPTEANMQDLANSITDLAAWGKVLKQFALEQRDPNRIDWLKERYAKSVAGVPAPGTVYRNGSNGHYSPNGKPAYTPQPAGPAMPVAESVVPEGMRIAGHKQNADGSFSLIFEPKPNGAQAVNRG